MTPLSTARCTYMHGGERCVLPGITRGASDDASRDAGAPVRVLLAGGCVPPAAGTRPADPGVDGGRVLCDAHHRDVERERERIAGARSRGDA